MNQPAKRWSDLGLRIGSALVLAAVALGAILAGGWAFIGFVVLLAAAVAWEQARMFGLAQPLVPAAVGAAALSAGVVSPALAVVFVALSAIVVFTLSNEGRVLHAVSHAVALTGALAFLQVSALGGLAALGWLIGVVVLTDVGGYFGGRLIGGPKLWPAVSPKKTWAGTLTGWAAAAVFGALMAGTLGWELWAVPASVLLSAASQAGDLFESHVKRRRGIKDSSALIPGHGGVWDRFDAMLTGAMAAWVVLLA